MSDLRTRLVRLAHRDPSLRPHLLPILASEDVPMARQASGGRLALDIVTDATNVADLGGGNWAVAGICTVSALGMPDTKFRFERYALNHSETAGWTAAEAPYDPLRLAMVVAGLTGFNPPSAAEATDKPRLEFKAAWGGGNTLHMSMYLGSQGSVFPAQSAAHQYAAKKLVAELSSVPLKEIMVKALRLKGVRSVEGPARPTLRDVFVGDVSKEGDKRVVYVKYTFYDGVQTRLDITGRLPQLNADLRKAGIRY